MRTLLYAVAAAVLCGRLMADGLEPWPADPRLVAAYYFIWYLDGKTHKSHDWKLYPDPVQDAIEWTWQPHYPTGAEPDARILGLDDPTKWPSGKLPDTSKWPDGDDMLWQMAELRGLKFAGLDYLFVDIWPKADFRVGSPGLVAAGVAGHDGSPGPELQALFDAWLELDRRGEKPLKLALFADTPGVGSAVNLRADSPDGAAKLWEPIRLFCRQFFGEGSYQARMPLRALAAREVDGEARPIIGAFFPRLPDIGEWISLWDERTWPQIRRRFRRTFGTGLYVFVSQHLQGPKYGGWDGIQADGKTIPITVASGQVDEEAPWFTCLAGPQVREHCIAISPGYWQAGVQKLPANGDSDGDGNVDYPGAWRYPTEDEKVSRFEKDWLKVLSDPASFSRRLVVIETANELSEGTGISPCQPTVRRDAAGHYIDRWGDTPCQYLKLCRRYARRFRAGKLLSDERRPLD